MKINKIVGTGVHTEQEDGQIANTFHLREGIQLLPHLKRRSI